MYGEEALGEWSVFGPDPWGGPGHPPPLLPPPPLGIPIDPWLGGRIFLPQGGAGHKTSENKKRVYNKARAKVTFFQGISRMNLTRAEVSVKLIEIGP